MDPTCCSCCKVNKIAAERTRNGKVQRTCNSCAERLKRHNQRKATLLHIAQPKITIVSNQFTQDHYRKLAPRQGDVDLTSARECSIVTLGPCSAKTELPQQRRCLITAGTAGANTEEAAKNVVLLFGEGCKDGVQVLESRRNREGDG